MISSGFEYYSLLYKFIANSIFLFFEQYQYKIFNAIPIVCNYSGGLYILNYGFSNNYNLSRYYKNSVAKSFIKFNISSIALKISFSGYDNKN